MVFIVYWSSYWLYWSVYRIWNSDLSSIHKRNARGKQIRKWHIGHTKAIPKSEDQIHTGQRESLQTGQNKQKVAIERVISKIELWNHHKVYTNQTMWHFVRPNTALTDCLPNKVIESID